MIVMSGGMGTFTVCAALLLHAFQPSDTRVFSVPSSASTTSTAEIEKARCRPPPSDVHPICAASSPFLSLVAVPDGVSSAVLQSVADAVEQSVHTEIDRCVSSSSFTTTNVHPTLASWKSSVQVLPEGMSTRERSMVYERGGVVVGTCRVFCVDILHRRLSPSFIRVTVFLLTREVSRRSAEKYSSPLSLLFPSSSFSSALSGKHARRSLLLAHQEGPRWKRGDMFNFAFLVNILRDPPALWFPTDGRGEASATAFPAHVDREAPLYTAVATTAGSSVGGQPPSYVPPMTFFLSDDPIGVQFLAQSHQKGFPRFFTQLAVEEIMLFPRFRLEIMKFYEKKNVSPALMTTSKTTTRPHDFHRRIHVHRILVPPSRATNIIDHLLEKILQEIGVELREKAERIQRMEEEKKKNKTATSFSSGTSMSADTPASPLAFPPTATTAFPSPPSSSSWTTSRFQKRQYVASAMDETVPARYMPLSTPSLPSSSSSTTTTTTTASSSSSLHYIRKPWRDAHSPFILHFTAITSEMAADVSDWELDEDLSAAVFAHARTPAVGGREAEATPTSTTSHTHHREGPPSSSPPPWPYHALVYSLLDVRQLRRDLHRLTPYDFLWALQCALRLSKKAAATLPGLSTSPTPLWTLSSSFYDLVMAATERVGSVVAKKEEEDDDDEEEKQHPLVEPMTTTTATATTKVSYVFQPHPIHTVDPVQEVLVTMISSWCRTKAKKRSQGQKAPRDLPENVSNAPPLARRQCREAPGEDDGNANTHASTVVCTDSVLAHPPPVPPLPPSFLRPTATPNPSTSPTHASLPPPATTTTTTTTTTRPVPHVLLVIDFGADAILRTVQRLLYGKTHYPHLLLNRFLSQYQRLHYRPPLPSPEASPSAVVDDTTTTALSSFLTPTHAVVPLFTHSEATRATGEQSPREKEKKTNDEAEGSPAVPPPPSSSLVSPVDAPSSSSSSATTAAAAAASSWTACQWRKVLWNNDGALETEMTLQDLHGRIKKEEKDDEDDEDEPMGRSGRRSTAGSAHRLSPKGKTEANEIAASRHRHRHSQDHTRHTVGNEEEAWKEGDGESEEEKDDDAYTEERLMEFARLFSQRAVKDEDEDDDEEEEEDGKRKRKSTKNRKKKRPTKASDKKKGGKEEEVDGDTDEPLPGSGTDLPMDSLFSLPSLPEGILHPPSLPTSSAVSSSPSSRMPSLHEILMRQPLAPPPPPPAWFSRSSPSPSLAGRRTTTESEGLAHVPTNEAVMVDDEKDAYTAASDALSNVAGRRHHRRLPQKPAEVPMTVVGHKNENKRRKCEGNATTTTTPVVLVTEDDDDALPMPSSSSLPTSPPAVLPSGSTPSGGVHPTSTKWPDHTHASAAVVIEEEEAEEEEDVIVMDRNEYSSPPSHKGKESMRKRKKEMKEEEEEEEEVVVVEEGGEVEEEEGVTVSLPHPATTTTTTTTTRSSHPRLPTAKTLPPSSSPSNASPLTGSSPSPQDVPFELREWSASCAILEAMMGPPPRGGGEGEAETKNPQSGGTTTSHFSSTASSTSPPTASASPVAVVVVLQGDALEDETLRQWLMGTHPFFSFLSSSSSSSSSSSPVRIRDVILTKPDMVVLRQLETFWNDPHSSPTSATASSLSSSSVRVRLLVTPFSEWTFQHHVQAERTAFLSLGHAKATLPGTLLMSRAARQAAEFELASGLVQSRRRGGEGGAVGQFYHRFRGPSRAPLRGDAFGEEEEEDGIGGGGGGGVGSSRKGQPPTSPYKETPGGGHAAPPPSQGEDTASSSALVVLFDDREFRSHLPYALHASGMEVVPLTLRTADYVLSPEMAVERKSIPDLLQSLLHSGRLMKQLAALSAMYPLPVCLIEGSFGEPYRLVLPSSSSFPCSPGAKRSGESVSGGVYDTFSSSVYYRLGRLYGKFPGLCIWWTKNALHTAAIFRRMKCTVARRNASALNPALTMSAVALQEEEDDVMGVERSRGGRCPTRGLSWGDERQPPSAGIRRDADVALVLAPPPAERGGEGAPLLPADEHASTDSRPKGPEEKKDGRAFASSSLSLSVKGTPRHPPSVAMLPTPPPPHFKKNATMSVLAGKILHCFPGVTSANATGVMQLAGSLVGLSTIAKESLRLVMSEEEAEKLYSFLHSPIIEDVG